MSETHWKKLINPDYLGAYSLEPGKDMILTIAKVQREMITGTGGKKEECPVCHWQEEQKPMILNVTNMKTIGKMYGNYIEQWAGKRVQIYASTTKFGGDVVECLRIRKDPPEGPAGRGADRLRGVRADDRAGLQHERDAAGGIHGEEVRKETVRGVREGEEGGEINAAE